MKKYDSAIIRTEKGVLRIIPGYFNIFSYYENVEIEIKDGIITVSADAVEYLHNILGSIDALKKTDYIKELDSKYIKEHQFLFWKWKTISSDAVLRIGISGREKFISSNWIIEEDS